MLRAERRVMAPPATRLTTFQIALMVIEWSALSIGFIMVMVVALMRS